MYIVELDDYQNHTRTFVDIYQTQGRMDLKGMLLNFLQYPSNQLLTLQMNSKRPSRIMELLSELKQIKQNIFLTKFTADIRTNLMVENLL